MIDVSFRIVTPSYQQRAYVGETIRSVLSQNVRKLSYFVADGGSTDGTVSVLDNLLRRDQWRSRRDGGQVDALSESFQQGDEEILGWVNSDDYLLPAALERVARAFRSDSNLAIVHGDGQLVDEAGVERVTCPSMRINPAVLAENNVLVQPSTFFRRSWYERVGGFDPQLTKAFDYDLFLRIIAAGGRSLYLPHSLSAFRIHREGQTSALWQEFIPEVLAIQWKHGVRRHFARRYASKLCLLSHGTTSPWRRAFAGDHRDAVGLHAPESEVERKDAAQFLATRLDQLLCTQSWRLDAPVATVAKYMRAESLLLKMLFDNGRTSGIRMALGMVAPANLWALAAWGAHVAISGQLHPLWQVWRLTRRRSGPTPGQAATITDPTTSAPKPHMPRTLATASTKGRRPSL